MNWYSVHVVMLVHFKDGNQDSLPAWENVYLIQAVDPDEASRKGETIGKQNEGDSSGTFFWEDRPAEWMFKGIRKITEIAGFPSPSNIAEDVVEITYQTIEFDNEVSLKSYLNAEPVSIKILD